MKVFAVSAIFFTKSLEVLFYFAGFALTELIEAFYADADTVMLSESKFGSCALSFNKIMKRRSKTRYK